MLASKYQQIGLFVKKTYCATLLISQTYGSYWQTFLQYIVWHCITILT